jgi:hypothetical protein
MLRRRSGAVLESPTVVASLDDFAVVSEAVEQSGGHLGVPKNAGPFTKSEVGGDDDRGLLVEAADKVEQQLAAGLGERQVAKLIEYNEIQTAERSRFARQHGLVVPGVEHLLVLTEHAPVLPHHPAVLAQLDPLGIGPDLDRPPHRARHHRVLVVVKPHQAGLGHRGRHGMEPVEPPGIRHKAWPLRLERLPRRSALSAPDAGWLWTLRPPPSM